ncbi:MAG: hypothetical protein ACI9OJ_003618 [Myxococcota bacterium]
MHPAFDRRAFEFLIPFRRGRVAVLRRAAPGAFPALGACLALAVHACSSSVDPEPDPTPQGAVGILPLGNSITQADVSQLSYRYALWTRMVDGALPD